MWRFEEENSVSFNVNAFRAGPSGTAASLAKKVRTLFSKSYLDRTDKDIDMLYPVVEQLNVIKTLYLIVNYLKV